MWDLTTLKNPLMIILSFAILYSLCRMNLWSWALIALPFFNSIFNNNRSELKHKTFFNTKATRKANWAEIMRTSKWKWKKFSRMSFRRWWKLKRRNVCMTVVLGGFSHKHIFSDISTLALLIFIRMAPEVWHFSPSPSSSSDEKEALWHRRQCEENDKKQKINLIDCFIEASTCF